MKLKLLFFMGILSVLFNTMNGQNTAPVFQVPPPNRTDCPGYVAANIQYQVTDANTPAPLLVVTASAVGAQAVNFNFTQDPTGILRAIDVIPVGPIIPGIVTVTLTLSDVGVPLPNLSTTAVFTVNFEDITDPIISTTLPLPNIVENISATAGCKFTVPDYTSLISATDYCGGVTITQSPAAGTELSVAHNDVVTITITATDDYGNDVSTSFDVTLEDVTDPTISTVLDFDVDINALNCDFTIPDYTGLVTTTDNCGTVTVTQSPIGTTLSNHNTTQIITLTADDGNGNTTDTTFTITLKDVTDPAFTSSPTDSDVNVDALDCSFTIPDYAVSASATDNCGATTITQSPAVGTIVSGHNTTQLITLTADDGNGNTTDATFTITLKDVTNPIISAVADFDVEINTTDCDFTIPDYTGLVTTSDNCGTVTVTQSPIGTTLSNHNTTQLITLTADDGNGNSDTSTFTITLKDVTLPIITTNGDFDVDNDPGQCGALVTVSATATDNCTSPITPTGVRRDDFAALNASYPVGTTTITWTATDAAGNLATTTQTVTVNDIEDPVFASLFPDLTVNNDPGLCSYATSQLPVPSVSDNCTPFSGVVTVTPATIPVSAGPDHIPSIVTWTATDNAGNTVTATQNVTVQDLELPVMRTKNITLYYDANGQIIITPEDIDNGSTDNSGTDCFTKYVVPNILYCGDKGDNSVILTGTDLWGNQHYKEATVTAVDNTDPTISAPAAITLNTNMACTWVGTLVSPTTADNCSVASVTNDAPAALPLGDTTVTWAVTDASGNTAITTQLVTVNDIEKPVAIAKLGVVVTLDGVTGTVSITDADINNGSTDNCAIDTIVVSPDTFNCSNVGANVVTLTVTDESGNATSTTVTITVRDATAPSLVTKPYTATLSSTGVVTIVASDVVDSSSDKCGIKSTVVSPNTFTCANLGANTVTITVTDVNGNVTTDTAIVTVEDDTDPTITVTNITVNANVGCTWNGTLALPVTADNCSVASVTSDKAVDFAYPIGVTTVNWTVTDAAGNAANASQTVTVIDAEKPIALATDFSVKLNALGTATITVAQVNNGSSDNCGIKVIDGLLISKSSFDCTNVGANTVVLTVTDNSGNVSTANAIVTVIDDILPVIAPVSPIAVNTSTGICGANLTVTPSATATDNCTVGTPVGTRSDAKALNAVYPLGRTIITWNVKDANGNAALPVIQTVDVTDAQIPVITSNGNKSVNADLGECSAIVTVSATASDNCTVGTPTGVRSDAKPLAAAYPVGTTTITWNVTDTNGNAAVAVTQTVTVTDTQKPVITANGDKLFVNSDAGQCGALVLVSATATDNCSVGTPTGVRYFNGSLTPDGLPVTAPYAVGTTIIKWNVTDANTNTAVEVSQKVVVKDIQIPVINTTIATINANTDANICAATVNVTAPTASDNCTVGAPIGTRSDNLALNALYPIGTTTITWNVTDINGNVALPTTTTVKVKDVTAPTVITKNITVQLNVSGTASIVAADVNNGSTDGCGIASYSIDRTSFSCSDTGAAKTVTLTVIDIYGNKGTGTAQVTVVDPILPIAFTRNITVQLNAAGTVSILPSDINNGSTDNCSIASYTLSKSTFNCSNVGQNIITLTATDASGNNSIPVNATVIVQDVTAPVVLTKTFTAQLDAAGTVTITPTDVNNGSSDSCGIATYAISKSIFTCANVGENIIILTVTDVNGNVNQAFAKVIVVDSVKPIVVAKDIELVLDGNSVSITPEDVFVSATDACGVDVHSYSLSQDTFTIVDVLASPVTVTLSVTDVNGNVGTDTFLVTFPTIPTNAAEAITPNGDGINDTWVISNITNHPKSIVRVYNRWGSMVFSALNYQNDWDGKLNGSDATLPDGQAYYYQVDLEGTGSVDKEGWLYIKK